jgi:tetratricopeptide (TPR) repeat protein
MIVAAIVSQQFTVFIRPTALYFYLTVAMLVALAGDGTGKTASPGGAYRVVLLAGRVAAAVLFTVFAVRLIVADRALALTRTELEAGRLDKAIEQHRRALEWQPPGMNAELWYSRSLAALAGNSPNLLVRLQAMQRAIEAGERSTRSSEEPHNAWYSLAALYAVQDDATGVERCLRNATSASPNWYKPHWVLAQVLARTGSLEAARKEAATAVDLNGDRNPEVRRTLDAIAASPDPPSR